MRQPVLGLVTNNQQSVFQSNVIAGVREVADERDYALRVYSIADDPDALGRLASDSEALDGVLAIANAAPDDLLIAIREAGKAVSLVSHVVPGVPIPVVMPDNAQGIAQMVGYVVEKRGRRRLLFIRGLMDQTDGIQREVAFRRELMRHNIQLPEEFFIKGDFEPGVAASSVRRAVAAGIEFDAVVASDYLMAGAAVEVLRESGVDVPGDVSVVGFGDAPEAAMMGLTTVAADVMELGRRGARQLIGQIEGLQICGATVLSVRLIIRQT